jgi:hypothetical protein
MAMGMGLLRWGSALPQSTSCTASSALCSSSTTRSAGVHKRPLIGTIWHVVRVLQRHGASRAALRGAHSFLFHMLLVSGRLVAPGAKKVDTPTGNRTKLPDGRLGQRRDARTSECRAAGCRSPRRAGRHLPHRSFSTEVSDILVRPALMRPALYLLGLGSSRHLGPQISSGLADRSCLDRHSKPLETFQREMRRCLHLSRPQS